VTVVLVIMLNRVSVNFSMGFVIFAFKSLLHPNQHFLSRRFLWVFFKESMTRLCSEVFGDKLRHSLEILQLLLFLNSIFISFYGLPVVLLLFEFQMLVTLFFLNLGI